MTPNYCHPERRQARSEASRQTESKDPLLDAKIRSNAGNFRVVVRFFDDHETECVPSASRGAATECSPRRKPWDNYRAESEPRRGERKYLLDASSTRGATRK
jgi:hypothetical protein